MEIIWFLKKLCLVSKETMFAFSVGKLENKIIPKTPDTQEQPDLVFIHNTFVNFKEFF